MLKILTTIFLTARMMGDTKSPGGMDGVYRTHGENPYLLSMIWAQQTCARMRFTNHPRIAGGFNGVGSATRGNYAARLSVMIWSAGPDKLIDPTSPAR